MALNTESERLEIRIYIIGDFSVGKKSIARRIKNLGATKTVEDNYFIQGDPKDAYGLGKKKDEALLEKYNNSSLIDKYNIRAEINRLNLMKFAKIMEIEGHTIVLNVFPICEAEKTDELNDNQIAKEEDEDYEFEKDYHISLKNVKKEINKYLEKRQKNIESNLENVFLFVFELKDFSTFEQLQIYYDQLDKFINIQKNFKCALIGNKIDIRENFKPDQMTKLINFRNNKNIKYYEISTFNFFNFENFFEKMFEELIIPSHEAFDNKTFKERFHLLLSAKSSFSKAARTTFHFNQGPGPAQYLNNIYNYPEETSEFLNAFNKERFHNKIFIDKKGPIFPNYDKEKKGDKNKKKEGNNNKNNEDMNLTTWNNNRNKKDIQDALDSNIPGYSLGTKQGAYNLKQKRKNMAKKMNIQLEDTFITNNRQLHIKKSPELKYIKKFEQYENNKKENCKLLIDRVKEKEDEGVNKRKEIIKTMENEREKKMDEINKKHNKIDENLIKIKEENEAKKKQKNGKELEKFTEISNKRKETYTTPGPAAYTTMGKFDSSKGFTMGSKLKYDNYKKLDIPFYTLKDEFDIIANQLYSTPNKSTAKRFKDPKPIEPRIETKHREPSAKRIIDPKKNSKWKTVHEFLDKRKLKNKGVRERLQELEEENQYKITVLINKMQNKNEENDDFDNNNYDFKDINYNLVEDKTPQYSMGARLNHGSIFEERENYQKLNLNEEGTDINGKPVIDDKYINSLPRPQFNAVKPALPSFSFTHASRFYTVKPLQKLTDESKENMLFKNGKFQPDDKAYFNTAQNFFGTSKRQGPRLLTDPPFSDIKGFAEIIAGSEEKKQKINHLAEKRNNFNPANSKKIEEDKKTERVVCKTEYDDNNDIKNVYNRYNNNETGNND